MKKTGKIGAFAIILIVMLFSIGTTAFATEKTQDGLVATITSDKENYNSEEEIKLTMAVKNTNNFDIDNVSVEALLPDGIKLKNEQEKIVKTDHLKSGESLSLNLVAIKNTTELNTEQTESTKSVTDSTKSTPSNLKSITSNDNTSSKAIINSGNLILLLIIFVIFIVSIVIFIIAYKHRKKSIQIISSILCICMICSAFCVSMIPAKADDTEVSIWTTNREIYVEHAVNYDNYNISINMHLSYAPPSYEYSVSDKMMLFSDAYGAIVNTVKNAKFELYVYDEEITNKSVPLYENDKKICDLIYDEEQKRYIGNVELKSDVKCSKLYYCILENEKSNIVTVNFGNAPNNEELEREEMVENKITTITSKYQNDSMDEEKIKNEINELKDTLNMYIADGIVVKYNIYKDNVYIEFNSGVKWTFSLIPSRKELNSYKGN